jgi:predicted RNA-binding Zn ribbon-like protein
MTAETDFRFDGGATWSNLLATRGQSFGPRPIERIATPEAAGRWLGLVGFPPKDELSDADLAGLVRLREALRELAMAAVAGREPPTEAMQEVRAIATIPAEPVWGDQVSGVPLDAAFAAIAVQALVTLQGPDRQLLRQCAEVDCRWVFLDTSGRRHWCPSPACASRGRVRAHRARQGDPSLD